MAIILKLTITNMRQKKFRTILIILSIILSVGLMYNILSVSASTTRIFEKKVKKEVGTSELMILPGENSGEQFLSEVNLKDMKGISYVIPFIKAYGYSNIEDELTPITFTGMSEKNYTTVYGMELIENTSNGLSDQQVYIGDETAEVYKLKSGDHLKVTMAGKDYDFTISAIIEDDNNLSYDLGNLELLISNDTLNNILNLEGRVNGYFIKSISNYGKAALLKELKEVFLNYQINDVTDMTEFKQMINMIVTCLLLMVMAVIMVSTFIIYSSFKIIAIERMPLMGTLRSIGATRKMTVRTLLFEALVYGATGAMLGNALGVLILKITMKMLLSSEKVSIDDITYVNIGYFGIAFLIGMVLAVGSALIPIIKMSKNSIRSIIFAELKNEKHNSIYKMMIGFILIAVAFILFNTAPVKLQLIMDIIGTVLLTVGGALIIPMLAMLLIKLLSILLKPIYKDSFDIITANIKNDRTMMNNILLLAMGLGVILMINIFSTTMGRALTDVYATCKADAFVFSDLEDSFVKEVSEIEGVEHVYTTKRLNDIAANDGNVNLMILEGIDGRGYSNYAFDEFGKYLTDEMIDKFTKERSIILTRFTAKKYDLTVGDSLKIDFNGNEMDYKVVGIVPSIWNNGNMSFIYDQFLIEDSGVKNYQSMFLNVSDNADIKEVLQSIKELIPDQILPIETLKERKNQNAKSNNMMLYMMKAISIIAMFIGIIGIFNNFTISFISRKKLYATMRSLGLSKGKTIQNMLSEAFLCGMLGTVSGLLIGTSLIKAMAYTVEGMGISSEVLYYSLKDYLFVLICGIIISMISAVFPAVGIANDNIVSGLKYE